ncbi:rhodanese-like domain-containing protein [Vibrio sp. HN007]|uniref:rhodanese-like domain-containing protein n=1 Tax=Vibrio iocasae TaxID=3098914 RepID=UPI0035D45FBD
MRNSVLTLMTTLLCTSQFSLAANFEQMTTNKSDHQIIDVRPSEFFNGWPQAGVTEGGHLPGSVNLSAHWLPLLSSEQFEQQLDLKGLDSEKATYLYGDPEDQQLLKSRLEQSGFGNVITIDQPLKAYSGELVALDNFKQLVSANWLFDLLEGRKVAYGPQKGYKVVEVAWGPPTKHLVSHVPGAGYLNTNLIETEENKWNRVSDAELQSLLEGMGISQDTTVILYDRNNMAASRAANIFMYAGVKDVRLLDGGWKAWNLNHFPTEPLVNEAVEAVEFGVSVPAKPEYVIDIPEAKALLATPETSSLVSIRSWDEYTGKTSGYSYIEKAGRIKGARWGHAGSDAYHMEDFHNPDGTMLSAALIEKNWEEWGIFKDQNVAFFCGTGWRASEAFFYAHVMGWENISVFDGGWFEWSMDTANPVASGVPESCDKACVETVQAL